MRYMSVRQIAEKAGVTEKRVYYIKDRIGHLPTVQEVRDYKPEKKQGRPRKYVIEEE